MLIDLIYSWTTNQGVHSIKEILEWIADKNSSLHVKIDRISLDESKFWVYDKNSGSIINKNKSFFSICGIQQYENKLLLLEQPIIIQNEIGFLGIMCKRINGVLHFLIQAKIEPGNINKIQLSPTIQATKSNFTQKHGGDKPAFVEYFLNAKPSQIIVDQIQSEQSSRFFKKRNRNVILAVDESIDEPETHRWMTLGQIKELMRHDNLVNMDTRTVLSCIPFAFMDTSSSVLKCVENKCKDIALLHSLTGYADRNVITEIFQVFNNYKMFNDIETKLIDLYSLKHWYMVNKIFASEYPHPFRIIFCNISIEGREVTQWTQPLFEATGIATFGLICCVDKGVKKFLVHAKAEIGCFDGIELGPTIQQEAIHVEDNNEVIKLFYSKISKNQGIVIDVMLSEEGGRFHHEQNRNIILEIEKSELPIDLPKGYFWSDFKTLNTLTQVNNCLNIQLRNLLSLLEV